MTNCLAVSRYNCINQSLSCFVPSDSYTCMDIQNIIITAAATVSNSAASLSFGIRRFDQITSTLMDLHRLPYPCCTTCTTLYDLSCLNAGMVQSCLSS